MRLHRKKSILVFKILLVFLILQFVFVTPAFASIDEMEERLDALIAGSNVSLDLWLFHTNPPIDLMRTSPRQDDEPNGEENGNDNGPF